MKVITVSGITLQFDVSNSTNITDLRRVVRNHIEDLNEYLDKLPGSPKIISDLKWNDIDVEEI